MKNNHNTIKIGDFMWTTNSRTLIRLKKEVELLQPSEVTLTPKQFRLLSFLYRASPEMVKTNEIIDFVWESRPISNESLPQLINRTRLVLEDSNRTILINEPKVGYSLKFSLLDESSSYANEKIEGHLLETNPITTTETKPLNFIAKVLIILIISLTSLNVYSAFSAFYYSNAFKKAFSSTTYPYIKETNNHNIKIVIDNNECIYSKSNKLLKCQ